MTDIEAAIQSEYSASRTFLAGQIATAPHADLFSETSGIEI